MTAPASPIHPTPSPLLKTLGASVWDPAAYELRPAIAALRAFPAFAEPVARLRALVDTAPIPTAAAVAAIEGDVALTLAVLGVANRTPGPWCGRVESVVQAVVLLQGVGLREALQDVVVTDVFARTPPWGELPEQVVRHARTTAAAADRLAVLTGYAGRDRLIAAALLHGVGTLVLTVHEAPVAPASAVYDRRAERGPCGVDAAAAGAQALHDLRFPESLSRAVRHHRDEDATGDAAYVRLADLLAREAHGREPDPDALRAAGAALDLDWPALRAVLFDLAERGGLPERAVDPCPLSVRELQVLVELARGSVYKQIAHDLSLSTSTVRTHLHNIYGKLAAVDRAQAVLIARQRGWL